MTEKSDRFSALNYYFNTLFVFYIYKKYTDKHNYQKERAMPLLTHYRKIIYYQIDLIIFFFYRIGRRKELWHNCLLERSQKSNRFYYLTLFRVSLQ